MAYSKEELVRSLVKEKLDFIKLAQKNIDADITKEYNLWVSKADSDGLSIEEWAHKIAGIEAEEAITNSQDEEE